MRNLRAHSSASIFAVGASVLISALASAGYGQGFTIQVVDSQTGRGVPLVELLPLGGQPFVTDSAGVAWIDSPALLNKLQFFGVQSYGYSDYGAALQTTVGGTQQIGIDRRNLAERLYRITGPEIYGESLAAGLTAPIAKPLHNANVRGQDSVQAVVYHGQIAWFWGDTLYENGFGNFRTAGARSPLPAQGGLDPAVGVNLQYFVNFGSAREMMPLAEPGPVWIDGLFTVADAAGQERMLTRFSRIEPGSANFNVLEQGLALYNDGTNTFQRFQPYDLAAPITAQGHSFHNSVGGVDYLYFTQSYPSVRVRADWEHVTNQASWEAYTPLLPGARWNATNPPLEYDNSGHIVFGWKTGADPLTTDMADALVQKGLLARSDSPFRPADAATGRAISMHRSSVKWNDYRQSWVMIGTEQAGDSFLGEVWFAEAPSPEGPWTSAAKVVTHDRGTTGDYTFYNPEQHDFFQEDGGRIIYFEGTYANTFSGNSTATPLYDYNQMMYRLDLTTLPRMGVLRADFDRNGDVDGGDFLIWQRQRGDVVAPGVGADADRSGTVDGFDRNAWSGAFGLTGGRTSLGIASTPVAEPASQGLALLLIASAAAIAKVAAVRSH